MPINQGASAYLAVRALWQLQGEGLDAESLTPEQASKVVARAALVDDALTAQTPRVPASPRRVS